MPSFDTDIQDKIVILRGLCNLGKTPDVYELVKVAWSSDPADTVYYGTLQLDQQCRVAPVDADDNPIMPIEVRLVANDNDLAWFIPVKTDSSVGDEEIDLELWDGDGDISDKLLAFGEGCKVELMYWIVGPGVSPTTLLLPLWEGHLELGDGSDSVTMKIKAANGFRSSEEDMPDRGHVRYCQAVFGGLLSSQDEINDHDCPYNLHIGGALGTVDPDTGEPWTFCPRLTTDNCVERGVIEPVDSAPRYHLSHASIETTVENNQTKGPRLYETSHGNEANLAEPVRVVMGIRRLYGMLPMVTRRDRNNKNKDQGFLQLLLEGCEGPIVGFSGANVTVGGNTLPVQALHYADRNGEIGQAPATPALTPFNFSAVAHFRNTFGPLDPDSVDVGDASGDALVTGLRNIRVYYDAGNGLVGDYYRFNSFYDRMGRRIDSTINFASSSTPPVQGLFSENGFCIEWKEDVNYITFPFAEEFTISAIPDDVVSVWIDDMDTPIIDEATWPATVTGTFTPADTSTRYRIRIRYKQTGNPGFNPWALQLKWQSSHQSLQVIPNNHLFHDQTYQLEFTRNRAWQIARMDNDKRWGGGRDYADLNIDMWMDAAVWVDEAVTFTDPFGTDWTHTRALSDVELVARKEQQQIEDMCIAGRLSLPFKFDGKLCIVPLRALTSDELDDAPVFTDVLGDDCNILYEGDPEQSSLKTKQLSVYELKNQIKVSFDDITQNYVDTPLRPFEDVDAQLAAGRARGTHARKVNKQEYKLLGVTMEAQATKLGWSLLDLGPLDRGGLANNLSITFKIWIADALDIYPWQVIKVVSPDKLDRYGFQYFRIMEIERSKDLEHTITAQAYNVDYMNAFETSDTFTPPDPPSPDPPPEILLFGDLTYENNVLTIPVIAP